MLFYRIEDDSNYGCYAGCHSRRGRQVVNDAVSDAHPSPFKDSLLESALGGGRDFFDGSLRFGFSSVDQFRTWFYDDSELKALHEHGFKLTVYEIPSHAFFQGNAQCVMNSDYHKLEFVKETKLLTEFVYYLTQTENPS